MVLSEDMTRRIAATAEPIDEPEPQQLEPIDGVSLETYTAIIREFGARGNDQGLLPEIAASHGVTAGSWDKAKQGWGARITDDRALGSKFNALYTAS